MADNSKIEWCDASWTPVKALVRQDAAAIAEAKGYVSLIRIAAKMAGHAGVHCEKVSAGCTHCYSETFQSRCLPANGTGLPFDQRSRDLVDIVLDEVELLKPLQWKRPRKIFVCSQTDWCADFVTDEMRDRMLAVAALCPQHTFLFLTKRAERCAKYFDKIDSGCRVGLSSAWCNHRPMPNQHLSLPLPNVRLGFSAENQECFDARWNAMRPLAAAGWNVWCSAEPLLSSIDMKAALYPNPYMRIPGGYSGDRPEMMAKLSWVVVGGESGHNARPMDVGWVRSIIAQCKAAKVAVFCKQLGAKPEELVTAPRDGHQWMRRVVLNDRKGGDMSEWPEDLRIREFPDA